MTTKRVSFESRSGDAVEGILAEPASAGRAPGVVLVHEWWGVSDHIRSVAERLASAGFLVLVPDLFHGAVAKTEAEASALMTALDTIRAVGEIAGAAKLLASHERSNGKVGVLGFCMGGALSFASACHVPGLAAVVPFYGVPPAEKVDYGNVTAPVLAHFARIDQWATVEKGEAIQKQIEAAGKATMRLEVYDAQHAFVNDTRPEVYDAANAKLAWDRSVAFLREHLAG